MQLLAAGGKLLARQQRLAAQLSFRARVTAPTAAHSDLAKVGSGAWRVFCQCAQPPCPQHYPLTRTMGVVLQVAPGRRWVV